MQDVSFNLDEAIEQAEMNQPLPAGDYNVMVRHAEAKPTRDGNGIMFSIAFMVTDGDHQGRQFYVNFNIVNQNEIAQKLGRARLALVCKAAGLTAFTSAQQVAQSLVTKPMRVTVKLQDKYNEIVTADPIGGQVPPVAQPQQPAPQPPQQYQPQQPAAQYQQPPQQQAPQYQPPANGNFQSPF